MNNDIMVLSNTWESEHMIVTYTGKHFDYDNITKDSIHVEDIIPAITRINRFMGHTMRPYGVGEHTLMCYLMAEELGYTDRQKLLVLIHDFTEAYCGDVNTDLKNRLPEYKKIEREVELAIYEHLGIEPPTYAEEVKIKVTDYTMLVIEMRDLTHHDYKKKIEELEEYIAFDMLENDNFILSKTGQMRESLIVSLLESLLNSLLDKVKKGE